MKLQTGESAWDSWYSNVCHMLWQMWQ